MSAEERNHDKKSSRTDAKREKLRQKSAARANTSKGANSSTRANSPTRTGAAKASGAKRATGAKGRHSASHKGVASYAESMRITWKIIAILLFILVMILAYSAHCMKQYMDRYTEIRLTDEGFTHAKRFSNHAVIDGIDISEYQKEDFNWEKAKTSGVDFVFIRAAYRTVDKGNLKVDPKFAENAQAAADAGIMVGAYIYSQALNPAEAEEEADFLLEQVQDADITMPLVIDYELYTGGRLQNYIKDGKMPVASDYHDVVKAFCRKVEAAGYESAVYANLDMLLHYMDAGIICKEENVWLARFNDESNLNKNYKYWQCTESGMIGGYSGNVDHDFWYIKPDKTYRTRAAGKGKEENRVSIGDCRVIFHKDTCQLKRLRAVPKVSMTDGGKNMKEGRDYVLTFVNNTEPGTGYAVVRGIGRYKDWTAVPFMIE